VKPRASPAARRQPGCLTRGYSLLELTFVAGIMATVGGLAVPQMLVTLDDLRGQGAARYLAGRLQRARMEAVLRGADVALRFVPDGPSFRYTTYVDGNRNGVRRIDIERGIDRPTQPDERLRDQFPGVDIGTVPGLPSVDGASPPPGEDPVKLGAGNMVSFDPLGTSTTGSVYIRCRKAQYVIRVFGETGKTRIVKFDSRSRLWKPL